MSKKTTIYMATPTTPRGLAFYRDEWSGNADGAMDGTPGLTRTWMEPTPALLDDEGDKARAALATLGPACGRDAAPPAR